jgi:modulator of drug activity B
MEDFTKPFAAALQFLGVEPQPTFAFYDVFKNPDIENDLKKYKEHITKYI